MITVGAIGISGLARAVAESYRKHRPAAVLVVGIEDKRADFHSPPALALEICDSTCSNALRICIPRTQERPSNCKFQHGWLKDS